MHSLQDRSGNLLADDISRNHVLPEVHTGPHPRVVNFGNEVAVFEVMPNPESRSHAFLCQSDANPQSNLPIFPAKSASY
jgi:hypothetical protein